MRTAWNWPTFGFLIALSVGCGPATVVHEADPPIATANLISDQVHGDGTHGFFFLPPTVLQLPPHFTGTFDPTLKASARVCRGTGPCDAASALAVFSADGGTGGGTLARLRVLPKLDAYTAVWDTRRCTTGPCSLAPGDPYRLHVYLVLPDAEQELGYADLQVVDLRSRPRLDASRFSPLVKNLPYVIAFRIEKCGPVVCSASGGTVRLPDGPGVQVPANALAADTAITIQRSAAQPPSGALSAIYEFGPDGTTFAFPVTVAFPVPPGTTAATIYWTLPGSTTEYASLPTTIQGTTASAQVTHFSSGYVGAMDIRGTWAGTNDYTLTTADAQVFTGSYWAVREVSQNGDAITYRVVSSRGWSGACAGTIAGTEVTATLGDSCEVTSFDGRCTLSPSRTEIVDNRSVPMTMSTTWEGVYASASGRTCALAGAHIAVQGSYVRQSSPPVQVAGNWLGTIDVAFEPTPWPTLELIEVRTQSGSFVETDADIPIGLKFSCVGPLVGNTLYSYCEGSDGGSCRFTSEDFAVTFDTDPRWPTLTEAARHTAHWTFGGSCAGWGTVPSSGSEALCPTGMTICPYFDWTTMTFTGICTDLAFDPNNCGQCGTVCQDGRICQAALDPLWPCGRY